MDKEADLVELEKRSEAILERIKSKPINQQTKEMLNELRDPKYLIHIHEEDKEVKDE